MTLTHFILTAWNFDPVALLCCAAALNLYVGAFGLDRRCGWFLTGIIALLLALLSPLNTLADGYLFSAHMAQHILLLLVVPALLLLGLPGLPVRKRWMPMLASPVTGWVSGMGAMWFWHIPFMCNAAVYSPVIHTLQTLSLLACGMLFWLQILSPSEHDRLQPHYAVLYLGSACAACSVLGIIVTLSPVEVCSIYAMPPPEHTAVLAQIRQAWGFTPQRDQQVGGLLMWVPMCLIYFVAIMGQVARWYARPSLYTNEPL